MIARFMSKIPFIYQIFKILTIAKVEFLMTKELLTNMVKYMQLEI
jgi:hypothetical protein